MAQIPIQETTPITPSVAHTVIFADFSSTKFGTLVDWFKRDKVATETVTDSGKLMTQISERSFDVCVVNLVLGGVGPFELISKIRSNSVNSEMKIMVISRQLQKANIQNTLRAGANDFVAEPFESENLYHRIRYHLTPKQMIEPSKYEHTTITKDVWPFLEVLLNCNELLCTTDKGKEHSAFFKVLNDVASLLGSNRTSLMIVEQESESGVVLASSDDVKFVDFPVSLKKYPEISHVVFTGQAVHVEDITQNVLTQEISATVRTISIGSLMVFPVRFANEVIGVLTIRLPKATALPLMETMRVLQALANTMAAHSNIRAALRRIYKDFAPTAKAS